MSEVKRNCYGDIITGIKEFEDSSFGYYDKSGNEHVNWAKEDEHVDSDGFDKHHIEPNGSYKMDVILPYGTLLCRYGNTRGRLTANIDSNYEELGLPYIKESVEYHVYRVIADNLTVQCTVQKGKVAPMFNSPGGAVQYKHYQSIAKELTQNKLEEVFDYE